MLDQKQISQAYKIAGKLGKRHLNMTLDDAFVDVAAPPTWLTTLLNISGIGFIGAGAYRFGQGQILYDLAEFIQTSNTTDEIRALGLSHKFEGAITIAAGVALISTRYFSSSINKKHAALSTIYRHYLEVGDLSPEYILNSSVHDLVFNGPIQKHRTNPFRLEREHSEE